VPRKLWMLCPARKNQDSNAAEPAKVEFKVIGNDRKGPKATGEKAAGCAGEKDGTASCKQAFRQVDCPGNSESWNLILRSTAVLVRF
jgi:hypothetical protein